MSDLIRRSDAIEAIEGVDWYHQNSRNKDMVNGANSDEHQAWYKADDVYKALEEVPSADRPTRVYEYLRERLGDIVDSEEEFDAWFERMVWHVEECNRLADRPQGEWIKRFGSINCSVCKHSNWSDSFEDLLRSFNYCPNCGARMKGADDE